MDLDVAVLLGIVGVMAANQLIMRVGALTARPLVFWPLQLVNLVVGTAILVLGLPGFEAWPVVSWLVGLLFFLHIVQNNSARQEWQREWARLRRRDRDEEAERLRTALEAAEGVEPAVDSDEGAS